MGKIEIVTVEERVAPYGYLESEKQYLNWLRSAIRSVWSKHPIKLALIQKKRYKAVVGKRAMFVIDCERCKVPHKLALIEVNHKNTVGSFNLKTFGAWVERVLLVEEDDLELLCKDCHGVQTYSERYNTDLVEAEIQKLRVKFQKLPIHEQDIQLAEMGVKLDKPTAKKRADAYVEYLRKETTK
jgi:hypothetical protein